MEKLRKQKNLAWAICLISFVAIFISIAISSMSWYPDRTLQGWPAVISVLVCLCSLIIAVNRTINYSRIQKSTTATQFNKPTQQSAPTPKNSPTNSVVSLICAIIPLALMLVTLISSASAQKSSSADQSGLLLFLYYCTIGVPLFFIWLICGIHGLKSDKRDMAIISLAIKPIGIILFIFSILIVQAS